MNDSFYDNWQTQIKKGYLDLCILQLFRSHKKLYGLQIIQLLMKENILIKEGTLYPLLSRLSDEDIVESSWDLKNVKGHPRKFYSLTSKGQEAFCYMEKTFTDMFALSVKLKGEHHEK